MMVLLRAGDAGEQVPLREPAEPADGPLADQPVPVHAHGDLALGGGGCRGGPHSTVWIFAIRAALISRALAKFWSSVQPGCSRLSMSQIALCSSMNSP